MGGLAEPDGRPMGDLAESEWLMEARLVLRDVALHLGRRAELHAACCMSMLHVACCMSHVHVACRMLHVAGSFFAMSLFTSVVVQNYNQVKQTADQKSGRATPHLTVGHPAVGVTTPRLRGDDTPP